MIGYSIVYHLKIIFHIAVKFDIFLEGPSVSVCDKQFMWYVEHLYTNVLLWIFRK